MNKHFEKAATSVKSLQKKASGLFGLLGAFVLDACYANGHPPTDLDVKGLFKEQEQQAEAALKVVFGKDAPSTYRVVKKLMCDCVAAGVSICDADGKLRGKSALEAELAEGKVDKSPIDKLKAALAIASKQADILPAHERIVAAALVQDLMDKCCVGIAKSA